MSSSTGRPQSATGRPPGFLPNCTTPLGPGIRECPPLNGWPWTSRGAAVTVRVGPPGSCRSPPAGSPTAPYPATAGFGRVPALTQTRTERPSGVSLLDRFFTVFSSKNANCSVIANRPTLWLWQYSMHCMHVWIKNLAFYMHYRRRFNRLDSTAWNHNDL